MSTQEEQVRTFITQIMQSRQLKASQLARQLGVSHATVGRWLKGEDIPSPKSCHKLSRFAERPIEEVLHIAGYLPDNKS